MRTFFLIFLIFFLTQCGKPKTVFICGDHVCVNKNEAKLYFEENLSIEVKIIDKNIKQEIDLVELNLNKNQNGSKKVKIYSKANTNKNLKVLSNSEKNKIKKSIKKREINKKKFNKKVAKKNIFNNEKNRKFQKKESKITEIEEDKNKNKKVKIVDICSLIEKCNIDEISKFLLKNKKSFPDITIRQ